MPRTAPGRRECGGGRGGRPAGVSLVSAGRVAVVVLAVGGIVSCGDDHAVETTGPYRVGTRSVTFVDESRPTPAFGASPAVGTRTVVTELWYPTEGDPGGGPVADGPVADGPFPLIVFNHGQQGEPGQYALSFELWARAGYVIAAPRHPLTVRGGPGAQFVDDVEGEMGDVPFVVTSIDDELSDLADVDHLAVAGHSSGAIVAFGTAFSQCCGDDRVDAVLAEGLPVSADGEDAAEIEDTPVMFIHGDADATPPAVPHTVFEEAEPPKYFLTIQGGDHSDVFRSGPSAPLVAQAALTFFDLHLKGRDEALAGLTALPTIEAVP
jgi:predicted dienelactone hydrolase